MNRRVVTPTPWRRLVVAATSCAVAATGLTAALAPSASAEDAGAPALGTTWSALRADAQRDGEVPVIVDLAAPSGDHAAKGRARAALRSQLRGTHGRHVQDLGDLAAVSVRADAATLDALRRSGTVRSIRVDHEYALDDASGAARPRSTRGQGALKPSTPAPTGGDTGVQGTSSNGYSTALAQWWDYTRIGVGSAKNLGWNGTGQTIAVIDSGVDRTHSWIGGHVVAEACFSSPAAGVTGGICPNGTSTQYGTGAAAPCTFTAYNGSCGHGTHTAQTAAGSYGGVASNARIIAVQIFHAKWDGAKWIATYFESDLTRALSYVYSLRTTFRIAAVNMSIGGGSATGYCDNRAIDGTAPATYVTGWLANLKAAGIASVVSTGNNNWNTAMGSPACISTAISVGNSTLDPSGTDAVYGGAPNGSNSNSTLDLLAPGTDICSALPAEHWACDWIGTSMAAPHVAGAIAVLRQRRPTATVDQILSALQRSGTAVYDSRNGVTRTRINVYAALSYI